MCSDYSDRFKEKSGYSSEYLGPHVEPSLSVLISSESIKSAPIHIVKV